MAVTEEEVWSVAALLAEEDGRRLYDTPLEDLSYYEKVQTVMQAVESFKASQARREETKA